MNKVCNDITFVINIMLYFLSNCISLFVFIYDVLLINLCFLGKMYICHVTFNYITCILQCNIALSHLKHYSVRSNYDRIMI